MPRDTRHRDRVLAVLVTTRQCDSKDLRGSDGVIVEHLIEVSHSEEQDGVRVLILNLGILV